MSWDALAAFRACLGDGEADKYEFKSEPTPTPDGVHTTFFVGHTRIVEAAFAVTLDGESVDSGDFELDAATGVVTMGDAPTGTLLLSYYWQWFTDNELTEFLNDGANQVGYDGYADTGLPPGLRSAVLDLSMAHAFTRKASEYADAMQAAAPDGYSLDTRYSAVNWTKLAADATKRAEDKIKRYLESPLTVRPTMAMTSYRLPVYTPRIR